MDGGKNFPPVMDFGLFTRRPYVPKQRDHRSIVFEQRLALWFGRFLFIGVLRCFIHAHIITLWGHNVNEDLSEIKIKFRKIRHCTMHCILVSLYMVNGDHQSRGCNIPNKLTPEDVVPRKRYRIRGSYEKTVSISIRFSEREMALFDAIIERRNANTEPEDRLNKTRVVLTQALNWIIDNADNDAPFPSHPSRKLMKHDV